MKHFLRATTAIALGVAAVAYAGAASADTITNGWQTVGLGPNGELYQAASGIGQQRISDGFDPISPGSPRDSWGVTTNLGAAYADQADFGNQNLTGTTWSIGASTASAWTGTTVGVSVSQNYGFKSGPNQNFLAIEENITNTSGTTLTGVYFQRDVDYDINPTPFNENSFGPAKNAARGVEDKSYYGFENPTAGPFPLYAFSCAAGCNSTSDLGAGIDVSLGDLAPGQTKSVTYLYGLNLEGQNVNDLIAQLPGLGAYDWVASQSSENGAWPDGLGYNSAILAVAVPGPVPGAGVLGLAGLALAGLYARARAVRG